MGYFYGLLLLFCLITAVRLRNSEAIVLAAIMIVGSAATLALFIAADRSWQHLNDVILAIDLTMLVAFAAVSLRSTHRWPMLVCAMQFIGTASHLAGMLADDSIGRSLGVAQGLWAYFQCFAIIFGVMYHRRATFPGRNSTTGN